MDDRHRTFSDRHPTKVIALPSEAPDDAKESFKRVFGSVLAGSFPAYLVDCRAQADGLFMNAVEEFGFFKLARQYGIRIVVHVYPTDDFESMTNLSNLVKFCWKKADFLIVENPARSKSRLFPHSPLEKALLSVGSKTIRLPTITSSTMAAMDKSESSVGRGISFAEFVHPDTNHLDPLVVAEIEIALRRMNAQFDEIAHVLVPPDLVVRQESINNKKTDGEESSFFGLSYNL